MSKLEVLMKQSPTLTVLDSFVVANNKINNPNYEKISASISGGADSDIVVDILTKLDANKKIEYVFFDTGLEYQATKEHLKYLEDKYGINILVVKAIKPIPTCCKTYGQPFLSKFISEMISRLQSYNFKWEDKPLEELLEEYPKCKGAIMWWCNGYTAGDRFNIRNKRYLKEFLIKDPPDFFISNKCCTYAKKNASKKYQKNNGIDLHICGVRKAEGGIRSVAYKNCFSSGYEKGKADEFRVIFWYTKDDKKAYEDTFNVTHSKCYTEYGLPRTGCAGCPFGKDFEQELNVIAKYEPKLYKAVNNIFGNSYEYTRKYKEFVKEMKLREN